MAEDIQGGLIETVIEARELVQELHGLIEDARRARSELAEAQAPAAPAAAPEAPERTVGRRGNRRTYRPQHWAPGN